MRYAASLVLLLLASTAAAYAQHGSHSIFQYYYTAFFTEPWRRASAAGEIALHALVVSALACAVHFVRWKRR